MKILLGAILVPQRFSYFSFNFLDCSITLISAQSFDGCDYYKELSPGIVYSIVSPNYKNPYAPGTFCRYTGMYFWMHFLVLILNSATFYFNKESSSSKRLSNYIEMHGIEITLCMWELCFFRFAQNLVWIFIFTVVWLLGW